MQFVAGLLLMAMAIVAFVGIGAVKAYAIGFLLPVVIYAGCVVIAGHNELDPYDGKLPTVPVLRFAHQQLVTKTYIDPFTGKPMPDYDPAAHDHSRMGSGGTGMESVPMGGGMGGFMPGPSLLEIPDRPTFMTLAHTLLALIFGWLGSQFAVHVYRLQHPQ